MTAAKPELATGDPDVPLFSIVTPVYAPPLQVLQQTIDSVLAQTYSDWELILVDDCSPDPGVREVLRSYAARDRRIRVIERAENGHIVAASNDGIDAARGEFIALLDHDDLLVPQALARNAAQIARHDDVDYLYSDEDKVGRNGKFFQPFLKPAWSPERLRGQNYCCHFSVLRTSVVREVGGFRAGYDGSQDHDLILRVTEVARRVVHIPEILYHWRVIPGSAAGDADAKPYAAIAGAKAVQDQVDRLGIDATVDHAAMVGTYSLSRRLPAERRVSIVIPTRGSGANVWGRDRILVIEAVASALEHTEHENLEFVIVYDEATSEEVLEHLRAVLGDKLRLVAFREPFNFSRKMNFGVLASTGDRIVMLNDDVEVRSSRWIEELVGPLEEPDVGMTGATLWYSSNTVQHAGLAFSRGHYDHPYHRMPYGHVGDFGSLVVNREVSGVTGACAAMRRETFLEIGGFCESLPANFNDVDLSYKVRAQGYRVLCIANCELFHFESMTRPIGVDAWEVRFLQSRWGYPTRDAYNPIYPAIRPSKSEREAEAARLRRKRQKLNRA